MTRDLFVPPWLDDVNESIHALDLALASRYGVVASRGPLLRARDRLNDRCVRMELDGEAECEEELYLALFDALSYLTSALAQFPLNRSFVVEAVACLRRLRDERGHS